MSVFSLLSSSSWERWWPISRWPLLEDTSSMPLSRLRYLLSPSLPFLLCDFFHILTCVANYLRRCRIALSISRKGAFPSMIVVELSWVGAYFFPPSYVRLLNFSYQLFSGSCGFPLVPWLGTYLWSITVLNWAAFVRSTLFFTLSIHNPVQTLAMKLLARKLKPWRLSPSLTGCCVRVSFLHPHYSSHILIPQSWYSTSSFYPSPLFRPTAETPVSGPVALPMLIIQPLQLVRLVRLSLK